MKQFLDSKGNPLEVGHEYALVTYWEDSFIPNPASEWIKAVWDGTRFKDSDGCTWTEWLEPAGAPSPDVVY
jgi:hypothetical protein